MKLLQDNMADMDSTLLHSMADLTVVQSVFHDVFYVPDILDGIEALCGETVLSYDESKISNPPNVRQVFCISWEKK